jgi:diacylglycerol kinase (ATP)
MRTSRIGVVINPMSGRRGSHPGEAERRLRFVEREVAAAGAVAEIHMTRARAHATELARTCVASGCDVVVAMGGDGTVNEVAQGLVGQPVPLGILPCGSGDGLAQGLGLPADWPSALQVAMEGLTVCIDVGYANEHLFLNLAGIGFDASVGRLFATRKTRGFLGYASRTLSLIRTYRPLHYEVVCGDAHRSGRKFLIGFANAPEYGNWAVMAPDADVRDGLLDVLLIEAGHPLSQVWRARRLFWNRRAPAKGVERLRTRTARVSADHIVYHVDGEPFETTGTLDVRVRPQALNVRVPRFTPISAG